MSIDGPAIASGLSTVRLRREIVVLETVSSTNNYALEMAERPDADGMVVLAEYQTQGRGRLGRSWAAPRGASLLATFLLIQDTPTEPGTLTMLTSVAVCDAVRASSDLSPHIKWPNDIIVGGRKLAGILVESKRLGDGRQAFAVGVGINCLQHRGHFAGDLADIATSMEIESRLPIDRCEVARCLITHIDHWLARLAVDHRCELLSAWRDRAEIIGRTVTVESEGRRYTGQVIDVDPADCLVLNLDHGERRIFHPYRTSLHF